ncbi:MAG: hypothetical protein ACJAT4_002252 [Granulosicoccus sp.]|jgi:hypothetical protein
MTGGSDWQLWKRMRIEKKRKESECIFFIIIGSIDWLPASLWFFNLGFE